MPRYIRAKAKGGTFFFTVVTHRRQKIFSLPENRELLREAIINVRTELPFSLDAWVLLPDHLHCLWTLPEGDGDFSKRWALIKLLFNKKARQFLHMHSTDAGDSLSKQDQSAVWQKRFWEHQIRDEKDFQRHFDYIHYNPVKHGLVNQVRDWPFPTFHKYLQQGYYPENWGEGVSLEATARFGE